MEAAQAEVAAQKQLVQRLRFELAAAERARVEATARTAAAEHKARFTASELASARALVRALLAKFAPSDEARKAFIESQLEDTHEAHERALRLLDVAPARPSAPKV